MIKYAKIIDNKTGKCIVGTGTDTEYYIADGFTQMDVQQSDIDGLWYTAEKCPHKSEAEKAAERETDFKDKFFEIQGFNYYRKQPKGYTSALESLGVAYNMITSGVIHELPAGTFIFYPKPNFYIAEQCTEEWLIEHQIFSEAMSREQFLQFYAAFVVAWNNEMHESENANDNI